MTPCARPADPFPLKQVLVISDLSSASTNAAWRGGLLARDHGAWLRIMHIGWRGSRVRQGESTLEALACELRERLKIAVITQSMRSQLHKEVAVAAGEADLLVLRSAQGRPVRDWLAGLHPELLLQCCQRPTLVVRKPAAANYRRVLAAVDSNGDVAGKLAVAAAMTRAPHQVMLRALQAQEALVPLAAMAESPARDRHRAAERLRAVMEEAMEKAEGARRVREAPAVVFDAGADSLLARERSIMADLVVIGRRPCAAPALWTRQTFSRTVLAKALADVLVLPDSAHRQP